MSFSLILKFLIRIGYGTSGYVNIIILEMISMKIMMMYMTMLLIMKMIMMMMILMLMLMTMTIIMMMMMMAADDNDSDNDDEQTHGIASFRRKLASLFVVASWTLFYSIAPG